jgi:hypothetical protein
MKPAEFDSRAADRAPSLEPRRHEQRTQDGLSEILAASFEHVELETFGSMAIFAATNPKGGRDVSVGRQRCQSLAFGTADAMTLAISAR